MRLLPCTATPLAEAEAEAAPCTVCVVCSAPSSVLRSLPPAAAGTSAPSMPVRDACGVLGLDWRCT